MNVGRAIRLCRSQKSMTQKDLAKSARVSVSYLSLIEQNKRDPGISKIRDIAIALGIPVSIVFFLAAEDSELSGLDSELIGRLASTALTFVHESSKADKTLI